MDSPEAALHPMATVETHLYPDEEPDETRTPAGTSLEVSYKRSKLLMECRGFPHKSRLPEELL